MHLLEKQERSPWAIVSIILVIIFFGLFWWWQRETIEDQRLPMPFTEAISNEKPTLDLSSLEASAVNISIPSFELLF